MKYKVSDPQGVYPDQIIEVNFTGKPITESAMRGLAIGAAKAITVKAMAIEKMYGCPLYEVDESVVCHMFRTVEIRLIICGRCGAECSESYANSAQGEILCPKCTGASPAGPRDLRSEN